MNQSVPRCACVFSSGHASLAGFPRNEERRGHAFACGRSVMAGCLLFSLVLHGLGGWVLEFRPVRELVLDKLLLLDIAAPLPVVAPAPVREAVFETSKSDPVPPVEMQPDPATASRSPARDPVPEAKAAGEKTKTAAAARRQPRVQETRSPTAVDGSAREPRDSAKALVPVGRIEPRSGVTVLANESGQDTLKHGAEARFMHGVATEEFIEENYVGEYSLGKLGRVWIEDDRARSGHLVLHVEGIGLTRPLFRFNRFIYVYGETPHSPEPILGSVTFFSDGEHIHQFLMQHNSTHAYYPRRD